ncbi:MAG: putative MarR family transcriptional regulator [Ilumatobacteraceae bacterium]|nr:putative MarR family transcriptional regulator [Ilumatobacteraceae bacterium]
MTTAFEPVDLRDADQLRLAVRIGLAWIEIRRGGSMATVRDHLYGTGDDAIDQGQCDTLDLLVTRPSWRMSELADALRVDPSTATRAIQRVVNAGMATRRSSSKDGRVVMVSVTQAGKRRHAEVDKRRGILLKHLMSAFSADERVQLADMLERFIAAVDDFVERVVPAPQPFAPQPDQAGRVPGEGSR